MIEQLLSRPVAAVEAFGDRSDVWLYPEERAAIARAVEPRRREFATVRACAREAMAALGVPPAPLVPGTGGAPRWPAGVVGSMTHCTGYRAAVVALESDLRSVGIDAEPDVPLPDGVLDVVTLADERSALTAWDHPTANADTVLFCAKEAFYKAWFPLTHRFLEFRDVTLAVHVDGTFDAAPRLTAATRGVSWPDGFSGLWRVEDGLVVAAGTVPAGL